MCCKNKLYFGIPHPKRATYTQKIHKKAHQKYVKNQQILKTKIGQNRPQVGAMKKNV